MTAEENPGVQTGALQNDLADHLDSSSDPKPKRRPCSYQEALVVRSRLRAVVPPPAVDPELWSDALTCLVRGALDRERERLQRAEAMKAASVAVSAARDWSAEAKFLSDRASSAAYIPRAESGVVR